MTRSPSPGQEPRKRGRVACVPCRQAKVRCDFESIPCTRCRKLDIDCTVNPAFKRTNKRDKVNELEDDVQMLRSIVEKQQAAESLTNFARHTVSPNDISSSAHNGLKQISASPAGQSNGEHLPHFNLESMLPDGTRLLGKARISSEDADRLFSIYFDQYHQHLPILDSTKPAAEYHDQSSVLFWCIISIGLRSYRQGTPLLDDLSDALSTYVWSEIGSARKNVVGVEPSNIFEVQSLLLLSTWPLPNTRLWSDRTLIMSNLAVTSAMHIGMHRPGFDFEYERDPSPLSEKSFHERSATWVACYCLAVSLALEFGHMPLVPSVDWLINKVCSEVPHVHVPIELRHFAIIQKKTKQAFEALAQLSDNPAAISAEESFFPLVARYEQTLIELDTTRHNDMSLANRVRSKGALLLLQQLYFLADYSLDETRKGVLKAYHTSVNLIQDLMSSDDVNMFLESAPFVVLRIVLRAGFTMVKIFFSSYGTELNRAQGKFVYDAAALLIRQMAYQKTKNDKMNRTAQAMTMTWKHMESVPDLLYQPPALRVRSRMAASLQFDCLTYYRDAVKGASKKCRQQIENVDAAHPTTAELSDTPWSVPDLQAFADVDLSWLDNLIDPTVFQPT